jgi:hypothetical protein
MEEDAPDAVDADAHGCQVDGGAARHVVERSLHVASMKNAQGWW